MQIPLFKPPIPEWIEQADYHLCTTEREITDALNVLGQSQTIALDTETSGLEPFRDELAGISMSCAVGSAYYFPVGHLKGESIDPELVDRLIKPFISSRSFIFHNSQFDIGFLKNAGIDTEVLTDTLLLARSYDFRRDNRLKALGESMLGLEVIELMDLSEGSDFNFAYFTPEYSYLYACQDADLTYRLYLQMKDQTKITKYIHDLEAGIIPALAQMELQGFPIDSEKAQVHYRIAQDRATELEESLYSYAGMTFNAGSNEQLSYVLFNKLGLKSTRKTDGGKASTGDKALKDIKNSHPIIKCLLEYRELEKMLSSFYDPYFQRITAQGESRIYSHFNPQGARTGRFSSSNVNLQQVSPPIKEIFIPEKGYYLVEADYSQIEYRIFASECRDPYMMQAFIDGKDMHEATTEKLRQFLGIAPDEEISEKMRKKGKTLNFSVLFGSGPKNVAGQLGCSEEEAEALIEEYYNQFPTVSDWKEQMHMKAVDKGYCETKFGRRRYIPELDDYSDELYEYTKTKLPYGTDQWTKSKFYNLLRGLRIAVNTPIQGTAADIFKVALRRVHKQIVSKMDVRLHAIVHDSFIFSVSENTTPDEFKDRIKSITEINIPEYVPILMDVKFGYNWKNLMGLEKFKESRNV